VGSKRFVVLDLYRFLAAMGVFFFHFAELSRNRSLLNRVEHFQLFVDFFFVLSGFVIARTYRDSVRDVSEIATFLRRRVARIYPLHVLMLLVFLVTSICLGRYVNHPEFYPLSEVKYHLVLAQAWGLNPIPTFNMPSWSISAEMAMYLMFPLFVLLFQRAGNAALAALVVLSFCFLDFLLAEGILPAPWQQNPGLLRALPTFVLGFLIANVVVSLKWRHGVLTGLVFMPIVFVLMMLDVNVYFIIASFAALIGVTALGEQYSSEHFLNSKLFRMLGDTSYAIYMTHWFLLLVLLPAWISLLKISPPISLAFVLGGAITALSFCIFRYFERPMRDLISGARRSDSGSIEPPARSAP
jgi:peptidoglycan/LPS O-acetylase OafA/YrhL